MTRRLFASLTFKAQLLGTCGRCAALALATSVPLLLLPQAGQAQSPLSLDEQRLVQALQIPSDIAQTAPEVVRIDEAQASSIGGYLGAMVARNKRDYRKAAQLLAPVLYDAPDRHDLQRLQLSLLSADGQYDQAEALAKAVLAFDDTSFEAQRALVFAAMKRGDYAEALAQAEPMSEAGLGTLLKPLIISWIHSGLGETDQALQVLEPLREDDGTAVFARQMQAMLLWVAGQQQESLDIFQEAFDTAFPDVPTRQAMLTVWAYAQAGQSAQAENIIQRMAEQREPHPIFAGLIAQFKQDPNALVYPINTPQQGLAEVLENMASSFGRDAMGGDLALMLASAALYLDPQNLDARLVRGELYADRQLYAYAIEDYEQIQGSAAQRYAADYDRAEALIELESYEEAEALLRDMAQRDLSRWDALEMLGNMFRRREMFAESADALAMAAARFNDEDKESASLWRFYYSWAIAHERLGDWEAAEKHFLKALELEPEEPNVMNYLAYSWVDRGFTQHYDQALDMLERAVEQRPNSGYIVDSLAWVLFKLGRYEEALEHMERAVELMPGDPILNDHLGDVYYKNGRKAEAVFQWKRALSFNPEDEDRARIERKLKIGLAAVEAQEAEDKATDAAQTKEADTE